MLEIRFAGEKIHREDINIFITHDLTFSIIIFIWYTLYQLGIYTYNSPLFALIITFIQNIIILSLLFYNNKINISNILKYLLVLFIFKLMPIFSFYSNFNITIADIIITFILYIIYIVIVFILIKLYLPDYDIMTKIFEDISGKSYKDDLIYYAYDYVNNSFKN
jgi:hypothetical protein